jgi:23S rRNA pseudouridine2605 synthase
MPPERLQKILARAGVASRRESEALIAAGRVTVDGRVATVGEQADAASATIAVDGRPVAPQSHPRTYLALHKPAGVTSTARDRHAARTVLELVPHDVLARAGRLYPVGRLDLDSEGLIFLTNDGEWTDRVLHPSRGVEREYAVGLRRPLGTEERRALDDGIRLDEGLALLEHLRPMTGSETARLADLLVPLPPPLAWYRATLRQGWKRQLRRMFAAAGCPIERLVRVRVGTVRLDGLRTGESRPLSSREAAAVTALVDRAGGRRPG